jgi:hypothetical protein
MSRLPHRSSPVALGYRIGNAVFGAEHRRHVFASTDGLGRRGDRSPSPRGWEFAWRGPKACEVGRDGFEPSIPAL